MGRISAYLNAMKDKNNLTQQQLADMTGILVVAMHGSLDELPGIPLRQAEHDESAYKAVVAGLEARLDEKNDRIRHRAELLDDEQQRSERETRRANRATLIACIIGAPPHESPTKRGSS